MPSPRQFPMPSCTPTTSYRRSSTVASAKPSPPASKKPPTPRASHGVRGLMILIWLTPHMSRQFSFFSTRSDLLQIGASIEARYRIKYVCMGLFDDARVTTYGSILEIPKLGTIRSDSSPTADRRYMLV